MRQNVSAGSTAVGTKVQAKLAVATLVNGVVIPVGATLSGEVTESVAKSATDPSRLAIYMDAAQWKNGSVSLKVYLTAWYYPEPTPTPQDSSLAPPDANPVVRARNRGGIYPDPTVNTSGTVPASDPYPGRDPGRESSPPLPAPGSNTPRHRVLMKDVESTRASEGALTLISKRSNLKLNKQTTYVFASGELLPLN